MTSSARSTSPYMLLFALAGLLSVGACDCMSNIQRMAEAVEADEQDRATAGVDRERLSATIEQHRQAWRTAMSAAMAVPLADEGAPCAAQLPWPDPGPGPRNISEALASDQGLEGFARRLRDLTFRIDRMDLFEASSFGGSIGQATPPLVRTSQTLLESAGQLETLDAVGWWDHDLVLVVDSRENATQTADGFTSGSLHGRAFLFDYESGTVSCAARVSATNSERIDVSRLMQGGAFGGNEEVSNDFATQARMDLEHNALLQAVAGLRQVAGPGAVAASPTVSWLTAPLSARRTEIHSLQVTVAAPAALTQTPNDRGLSLGLSDMSVMVRVTGWDGGEDADLSQQLNAGRSLGSSMGENYTWLDEARGDGHLLGQGNGVTYYLKQDEVLLSCYALARTNSDDQESERQRLIEICASMHVETP